MRITEQGETIEAKFGLVDIAVRTLEVYTSAMLDAAVTPQAAPRDEWRATIDRLARDARAAYRATVYETPEFLEYFHAATPEPELRTIRIDYPVREPGQIVDAIACALTARTRLVVIDHITAQTALVLPVADIAAA